MGTKTQKENWAVALRMEPPARSPEYRPRRSNRDKVSRSARNSQYSPAERQFEQKLTIAKQLAEQLGDDNYFRLVILLTTLHRHDRGYSLEAKEFLLKAIISLECYGKNATVVRVNASDLLT